MPQQAVIEGDLVRILNVEVVREARLQDLMGHIETRPPITVGMLPKTAVIFHWDEQDPKNKRAQFICEVTPGVRTARYGERRYQISLPWTYFMFDFRTDGNPLDGHTIWRHTDSRIYWALEQVVGMKSPVGTALVPNCNTEGGICYGTTGVDANLPLGVRVDRLVDEFYRTTFTHDSGAGTPWYSETGLTNWARWDQETRKNPQAWREFPEWKTSHIRQRPIGELLGTHFDRSEPIRLEGTIPDLIEPMTFGRAEEWLIGVTPQNRHRLLVALQNLQADDAAAIEAPPAGVVAEDLGGEVIVGE